jgi:hypothetical protein
MNLTCFTGITVSTGQFILTAPQQAQLYYGLLQWFSGTEKANIPNLPVLEASFKIALQQLSIVVSFSIDDCGGVKACAPGNAETTLNQIRCGTLWFKGWNNADLRMLALVESDTFVPIITKPAKHLTGGYE